MRFPHRLTRFSSLTFCHQSAQLHSAFWRSLWQDPTRRQAESSPFGRIRLSKPKSAPCKSSQLGQGSNWCLKVRRSSYAHEVSWGHIHRQLVAALLDRNQLHQSSNLKQKQRPFNLSTWTNFVLAHLGSSQPSCRTVAAVHALASDVLVQVHKHNNGSNAEKNSRHYKSQQKGSHDYCSLRHLATFYSVYISSH